MSLASQSCRLVQPGVARRVSPALCIRAFSRLAPYREEEKPSASSRLRDSLTRNNPLLAEYLAMRKPKRQQPERKQANLPSSSIFELDRQQRRPDGSSVYDESAAQGGQRDPAVMAAVLDPQPDVRQRWEAKMVARSIRRRGRLNKTQLTMRTERQSLTKSHFMATSVKKLGALARQIAGKPIEDAIVQMRFSKKKAAKEVKAELERARDEAIVRRGMGLGAPEGRKGASIEIELKDGKKRIVDDRTGIYVDQAWVGRGEYGAEPEYRARGRVNTLRPPHTSISLLLKEQATRVREAAERQKKRERRKLWVQLPDRPVTSQRQYYSW